mmetsp:Transcript_19280/g.38761  ORF Transcript_19280/g.38761 Transcript_19280/m.38761 type:complete len:115 (-) Transcript_19280:289-633(-)
MRKKATKVVEKPLAPQIEQLASFDLTVITSVSSDDDVESQKKVGISIVPYIEDSEEAQGPPKDSQRIEKLTKLGSFSLSALKVSVILVVVLLAGVPCRTDQIRKSIRQVVMHPH